jgi:hypothetical protein
MGSPRRVEHTKRIKLRTLRHSLQKRNEAGHYSSGNLEKKKNYAKQQAEQTAKKHNQIVFSLEYFVSHPS